MRGTFRAFFTCPDLSVVRLSLQFLTSPSSCLGYALFRWFSLCRNMQILSLCFGLWQSIKRYSGIPYSAIQTWVDTTRLTGIISSQVGFRRRLVAGKRRRRRRKLPIRSLQRNRSHVHSASYTTLQPGTWPVHD